MFKNRRDPRITRLGPLPAKTSLDETPQLFHVLLGQMSLVGPRPLDVSEVARFERLAAAPPGGHARPDLPLADQRPHERRLRGLDAHGPVVRAAPELLDRLEAIVAHAPERARRPRGILSVASASTATSRSDD